MNSFGIGGGGGLLRWIKNELIWNLNSFGGGVFYVGSKMNSFGIGGVFYGVW